MGMQAISLTPAAVSRAKAILAGHGDALGIRLGVRSTGCSGMSYQLDLAREIEPGAEVVEADGVKLVIDPKALMFVLGTEVDFVKEGLNEAFRFRNPNIKGECGCGESFTV